VAAVVVFAVVAAIFAASAESQHEPASFVWAAPSRSNLERTPVLLASALGMWGKAGLAPVEYQVAGRAHRPDPQSTSAASSRVWISAHDRKCT
jgi:hypothetical protein